MSGGSYNYLCYASDLEDLLAKRSDLAAMADRLNTLSDTEDVFGETEDLRLMIIAVERRVSVYLKRLAPVWKAIEWWDSCDWSEETFRKVLAEYRGEVDK